ncbi:inositol polyphosphate [Plasmopara halstedii]|uniref:Kinase n=1 Tax=Plasmopara halstedii TaxID=4781 RepID=A0A0P1AMP0_PLAHL|nr:inositol polyphosphate [Plasmopara halstedii]CEG42473.1 inositol polyphosphate [Plasmopara halstedii]|eukprot:XP_024578842.1 inositol polyphosphate [Plasmopara halstedii]
MGFTKMAHQVGGHATSKTSLKANNGRILKPFQSKGRGMNECTFYERVFFLESGSLELAELQKFLPKYYGTIIVPEVANGEEGSELHPGQYLMLEDLTWDRKWPCIMDVKMGTQSYEDDASAEKIAHEKSKFPLQEIVGLRIQGIKVFDRAKMNYNVYDKYFGRNIADVDHLAQAFQRYFPANDIAKTIVLLEAFLRRLDQLRDWFEKQRGTRFIASSFLFLYDGERSIQDPNAVAETFGADIRLIDFAHATQSLSPTQDDGLRTGIATLINCFQTLYHKIQTESSCTLHADAAEK